MPNILGYPLDRRCSTTWSHRRCSPVFTRTQLEPILQRWIRRCPRDSFRSLMSGFYSRLWFLSPSQPTTALLSSAPSLCFPWQVSFLRVKAPLYCDGWYDILVFVSFVPLLLMFLFGRKRGILLPLSCAIWYC